MSNNSQSWLSKLGRVLGTIAGIALRFIPEVGVAENLLAPFLPASARSVAGKAVSELEQISGVITSTEAVFANSPGSGAAKLLGAAPGVDKIIAEFLNNNGLKVAGDRLAQYQTAVTALTSAFADLLNAVEHK